MKVLGLCFSACQITHSISWVNIPAAWKKSKGECFILKCFSNLLGNGKVLFWSGHQPSLPRNHSEKPDSTKADHNTTQLLLLTHTSHLQLSNRNELVRSLTCNTVFKTNPANKDSCQMLKLHQTQDYCLRAWDFDQNNVIELNNFKECKSFLGGKPCLK